MLYRSSISKSCFSSDYNIAFKISLIYTFPIKEGSTEYTITKKRHMHISTTPPSSSTPFFNTTSNERGTSSSSPQLAPSSAYSNQEDKINLSQEVTSRTGQKEDITAQEERKTEEKTKNGQKEVTQEEQREIQKLQRRDAEVRAHEQAHLAAAGQHAAGGASYTYETGPDGKRYATGGEVPIDVSKEKTPGETLAKMIQVRKAALAPANPSGADRQIAAKASMLAAEARKEIASGHENSEAKSPIQSGNDQENTNNEQTSDDRVASSSHLEQIPSHTRHMALQAYALQS